MFASIISKLFHKDIISKSPDKNYGTANAFRYGGVLCGALTLLCDMGKGFLPVFIYMHTENPSEVMLPIVLVAPVIGHILPVFSKITPHCYCTIITYCCTTLVSFFIEPVKAVSIGMLMITIACSIKMLSVPEEREKFDVRWLWKH